MVVPTARQVAPNPAQHECADCALCLSPLAQQADEHGPLGPAVALPKSDGVCGHEYHQGCLDRVTAARPDGDARCPECRTPIPAAYQLRQPSAADLRDIEARCQADIGRWERAQAAIARRSCRPTPRREAAHATRSPAGLRATLRLPPAVPQPVRAHKGIGHRGVLHGLPVM